MTGSRAEYGLLRALMRRIKDEPALTLQLVVTGAHLSPDHGETWREIADDGFAIDAKTDLGLSDDSPLGIARAMGQAVGGIAEAYTDLAPEIIVLLGDRYEILAAAEAALLQRIPVAHIHGGELTEGAIDDAMRHAITKMSHLHFVAADDYARRVIQLGEEPSCVFTVGAMGLDDIGELPLPDRAALEAACGIALAEPLLLVTYHPTTLANKQPADEISALLSALGAFPTATILFTGVNADPGNRTIRSAIDEFVAADPKQRAAVTSLGRTRYLAAMQLAAAVIGNSSSGIIEAPALGVPTVNVGDRQTGRLRSPSVIDCAAEARAIEAAIRKAMGETFRAEIAGQAPAYGAGGASRRIADLLRETPLDGLVRKRFHDLPVSGGERHA